MVLGLTTLHWITHKGVNSWERIVFLPSAATSCLWFISRSGTLWKFPSSASTHPLVLPLFWSCLLFHLSISRWESFIAGFLLFWFLQSFFFFKSPPLTCFQRYRFRNQLIRIYLLCMWVYNMCICESAKHGVHVEVIEQLRGASSFPSTSHGLWRPNSGTTSPAGRMLLPVKPSHWLKLHFRLKVWSYSAAIFFCMIFPQSGKCLSCAGETVSEGQGDISRFPWALGSNNPDMGLSPNPSVSVLVLIFNMRLAPSLSEDC